MTAIAPSALINQQAEAFSASVAMIENSYFFERKNDKWSMAENLQHLVLSVKPLHLAYSLNRNILRMLFGKPNRPGRSYAALAEKYARKLQEGGKAPDRFVPEKLKTGMDKYTVVQNFMQAHRMLIHKVNTWDNAHLDNYLLPHPLLGKLTLREMVFFTAIHIEHHHNLVRKIYLNSVPL